MSSEIIVLLTLISMVRVLINMDDSRVVCRGGSSIAVDTWGFNKNTHKRTHNCFSSVALVLSSHDVCLENVREREIEREEGG